MKDTNLCPINITINLSGGTQFRMRIKVYATKQDYMDALSGKGGNQEVKELRREMNEYISKAETILERLPNPTKDSFTRLFKSETDLFTTNKTDIKVMFDTTIDEMIEEERLGTADCYKLARNSFLRFKKQIYFEDIDLKFLTDYIAFNVNQGLSRTTPLIYIRMLRALF